MKTPSSIVHFICPHQQRPVMSHVGKHFARHSLLVGALVLAVPGLSAYAAGMDNPATSPGAATADQPFSQGMTSPQQGTITIRKASEVIGKNVSDRRGEDIGEIKDLAIDVDSGRIAYVMLSTGGFLGIGSDLIAVPSRALSTSGTEDEFMVNAAKTDIKQAKAFDEENWLEELANISDEEISRQFRVPAGSPGRAHGQLVKASTLIGKEVQNAQNDNIGEIEELGVDLDNQHVAYAAVSYGGVADIGDEHVAVPLTALSVQEADQPARLTSKQSTLGKAARIKSDAWPENVDRVWMVDVYRVYDLQPYLVVRGGGTNARGSGLTMGDARSKFNQLDKDNDGVLSEQEVNSSTATRAEFDRLDNDGNGQVDIGEFARFETQGTSNSASGSESQPGNSREQFSDPADPKKGMGSEGMPQQSPMTR